MINSFNGIRHHRCGGFGLLSVVVFATICLTSCDDDSDSPDMKPATTMSLTVNGEHYEINLTGKTDTINLRTLTVEFPSHFTVDNPQSFPDLTIGGKEAPDGDCYLMVDKISHLHHIDIVYTDASKVGKIHKVVLNTLHKRVPPIVTKGNATSKGDFYLSFVYLRLIEKVDNKGRLLYYRFEPLDNFGDGNTGWWDFKKHHADNGNTYYSYHEPDSKFASLVMSGFNPGKRIIMDEKYNKIKEIQLMAADGVEEGSPVDGHDFYMYTPHHYIVSSYIKKTSTKDKDIYAAYLQEVKNGRVVFDWWSTNHTEMEDWVDPIFTESEPDLKDYVHYNSIDILPDGNWLCSFRHSSSVVKIDRVGGTGNFLWRVAGADNDGSYSFHGQHYVRYHKEDGTVSIFNNGNDTRHTQLLRLSVNVDDGTVSGSDVLHNDGYFTQACGALVFSDKNTIAGWGIPGNNDDCRRLLTEYDQSGTEIFSISWPADSKVDSFFGSYRCVKCE